MKGITYTQVAQYCVMIFAYTIPAILMGIFYKRMNREGAGAAHAH
jgi:Na+(H+)/acetate symporter ActP